MSPPYTGLENRGNCLDKVEAKMYILPFGMDSPLVPLGHLGWKDSTFFQVQQGVVKGNIVAPLHLRIRTYPHRCWLERTTTASNGRTTGRIETFYIMSKTRIRWSCCLRSYWTTISPIPPIRKTNIGVVWKTRVIDRGGKPTSWNNPKGLSHTRWAYSRLGTRGNTVENRCTP